MALSHLSALRPLRAKDLDPLLTELTAISRQAEDIQHRIAVLQAGGPLLRPGWPMRRISAPVQEETCLPEAEPDYEAAEETVYEAQPQDDPVCADPVMADDADDLCAAEAFGEEEEAPAEDPLALILRIAGDLDALCSQETAPTAAELQIRAIRDRIARSAAFTPAYLPEARASI